MTRIKWNSQLGPEDAVEVEQGSHIVLDATGHELDLPITWADDETGEFGTYVFSLARKLRTLINIYLCTVIFM